VTAVQRSFVLVLFALLLAWAGPVRTQSTAAPMAVTVELGDVSATKVPFIVAAESGIYARNGLEVTQFITPLAADVARGNGLVVPAEYVRSGLVADISIGGGSPLVVNMTTSATTPARVILATTDTRQAFHVYAGAGIKNLTDLKGKRIGFIVRGSLDDLLLLALARKMHWNAARDWSMFSNVNGAQVAARTHMDAFLGPPLAHDEALKLGFHDLGDLSRYHFPVLGSGVDALRSWLPAHQLVAEAFVKSTVEAIALMKRDKHAAFAAMQKWYGLSDPARAEALYDAAVKMPAKPYPSVAGLHLVRALYPARELRIHSDAYFLDATYVRGLDDSGFIDRVQKAP
jgi:NitT/TauT family transport system substrate-binding protein